MKDNLYTIIDIVKWYQNNCDTKISDDFIIHMINVGILKQKNMSMYSLDDVNKFLLKKIDTSYEKNDDGKFIVKDSRKSLIEKYPFKEVKKPKRFKITSLDGNKLKLIKIN